MPFLDRSPTDDKQNIKALLPQDTEQQVRQAVQKWKIPTRKSATGNRITFAGRQDIRCADQDH